MRNQRPSERMDADLRESIANGYYSPGQQLPSVRALMTRYGVANQTAVNVINRLRNEGLVEGRKGAGVFVREHDTSREVVRSTSVRGEGEPYIVDRIASRVATSADTADAGIPSGVLLLTVTRTRYDGAGQPTGHERTLVPGDHELVYELPGE